MLRIALMLAALFAPISQASAGPQNDVETIAEYISKSGEPCMNGSNPANMGCISEKNGIRVLVVNATFDTTIEGDAKTYECRAIFTYATGSIETYRYLFELQCAKEISPSLFSQSLLDNLSQLALWPLLEKIRRHDTPV